MASDRLHRLQTKAIEETRKLFGIFLYLWVLLSLFSFHKALVLKDEYELYDQGFALINAIVLAKVILVGELFHLGEKLENKPLIYPILFKSAVFAVLLICFHIIEQAIRGLLRGMTFSQSIPTIGGGRLQGILMVGIIMFVVLMPFFAFRELNRALGAAELHALLFGNHAKAHGGLSSSLQRHWRLTAAGALIVAFGGGWLIWFLDRGAGRYALEEPGRGFVAHSVNASGTIHAAPTVPVTALLPGVLVEVGCEPNRKVREGEICAQLDPRPYQVLAKQAKADLVRAEVRLDASKEDLARAEAAFEHGALLTTREAKSRRAKDRLAKTLQKAQAREKLDEETVVRKRDVLRAAEANLAHVNILAPVSGTVVSRAAEAGQNAAAGQGAPPLFVIATPSVVQVTAKVGATDIDKIKLGDKATFKLQSSAGEADQGEVAKIGEPPGSGETAAAYDVIISAPGSVLQPGAEVAVTIAVDQRD